MAKIDLNGRRWKFQKMSRKEVRTGTVKGKEVRTGMLVLHSNLQSLCFYVIQFFFLRRGHKNQSKDKPAVDYLLQQTNPEFHYPPNDTETINFAKCIHWNIRQPPEIVAWSLSHLLYLQCGRYMGSSLISRNKGIVSRNTVAGPYYLINNDYPSVSVHVTSVLIYCWSVEIRASNIINTRRSKDNLLPFLLRLYFLLNNQKQRSTVPFCLEIVHRPIMMFRIQPQPPKEAAIWCE